MSNGGIIGPENIPANTKNVTSITSTTPGGHTFHPATTKVDYIMVGGGGGKNPPGIGNSGTGAGGLITSGDVGSFAQPVTGGGTTGAITIGAAGGGGSDGSDTSVDPEDPENHLEAVVDTVALVAHPEDTLNMDQDPVTQLQLQIPELQL